jgi:DNA-binding LacI/PurR family transcriptional regulator
MSPVAAVRLSDVAARAGVSVKTVSNVVHGYVHVREETRSRVQAALDELGYRPNLSARSLRQGRSGLVALAVPALDVPYFAELASAVVAAATDLGWTVLVDQTDGEADREREVAAGLRGHLIDGLILSPMSLGAADLRRAEKDVSLVLIGERISDGAIDHVAVDNVAASRAATEHLIGLGRTRIAAIGFQVADDARSGVAALRRRGYEEALAAAGLATRTAWTPEVARFTRAEGAAAVDAMLASDEAPDAVFAFNDELALGALHALSRHGLRVPDDVAVIGFDDIEDGRFSIPTLSTVRPNKAALARRAVELLQKRIAEPDAPTHDVQVPFELVARESTSGAPVA